MKSQSHSDDILTRLVAKAVELGAEGLDIEYQNRREEVCAVRGNMGFGIASLDSSSVEAATLRKQLGAIGKKGKNVTIAGTTYRLKVTTYDSFGETAFSVTIERGTNPQSPAVPKK